MFLSSSYHKNVPLYSARQEDSRAEEEDENIPAAGCVHVVEEKDESVRVDEWEEVENTSEIRLSRKYF